LRQLVEAGALVMSSVGEAADHARHLLTSGRPVI
jgi:hypothetical protein